MTQGFDNDKPPSQLTVWIRRVRWSSIGLIGFAVLAVLRLFSAASGLPGWISASSVCLFVLALGIWKIVVVGADSLQQALGESWQKLSDWLAVTGWRRLLVVGMFVFCAVGLFADGISDSKDPLALVVSALLGLIALKLARSPVSTKQEAPAESKEKGAAPDENLIGLRNNWLQRLSWPRLLMAGLLLLVAASVVNNAFDSARRHPVAVTSRSFSSSSSHSAPRAQAQTTAPQTNDEADAPDSDSPDDSEELPSTASAPAKDIHSKNPADVRISPTGIEVIERDAHGKVKEHVRIGLHGITVSQGKDEEDDIEITPSEPSSPHDFNFASLAFLTIVSLAIMKLLAGGKHRAEQDAGSARIAADMARLEREAADAKLHAMQAQIEPHFLFNTLASVDQLIRTDPMRASQVQKTLIQYLRAAIPQMRDDAQRSTLGRQVTMSRAYLEIMQVRMEERLEYSFDTPEGLSCAEFPSMMLQTLIENCIKHGLEPKPEGGRIDVKAEVARGKLRVQVSDTGVGFAKDASDGVGLANIRERLRLLYDKTATLSLAPNEAGGTIATIELPYRDDEEQHTKTC